MSFVPPGCITLKEAVRRAAAAWNKPTEDAWQTLRGYLYSGNVRGGYLAGGVWTDVSLGWGSPVNNRAHHLDSITTTSFAGGSSNHQALVVEASLGEALSGGAAAVAPELEPLRRAHQPVPARRKNSGGRPPTYDWDDIWAEICTRIHNAGIPEESPKSSPYAPLVKEIMEWHQMKYGAEPSKSVVHEKVKMAVDRIGLTNLPSKAPETKGR